MISHKESSEAFSAKKVLKYEMSPEQPSTPGAVQYNVWDVRLDSGQKVCQSLEILVSADLIS